MSYSGKLLNVKGALWEPLNLQASWTEEQVTWGPRTCDWRLKLGHLWDRALRPEQSDADSGWSVSEED